MKSCERSEARTLKSLLLLADPGHKARSCLAVKLGVSDVCHRLCQRVFANGARHWQSRWQTMNPKLQSVSAPPQVTSRDQPKSQAIHSPSLYPGGVRLRFMWLSVEVVMNRLFPNIRQSNLDRVFSGLLFVSLLCANTFATGLERIPDDTRQFRRPEMLKMLDANTAVVANRCGTLSLVDVDEWAVAAEFKLGGRLTDLAVVNGKVLVTDGDGARFCVVDINRDSARLLHEVALPTYPVNIFVSSDGRRCSVSSMWARKVTVLELNGTRPKIVATIDLPFAPREQLLVEEKQRLIVADAFAGRMAIIKSDSNELESIVEFGAHNIRGLAIHPQTKRLVISHQILNDLAVPRRSDIIWGVMVDNVLRTADVSRVLENGDDPLKGSRFTPVGYAGQGAGDPDSLFVDGKGRTVIAAAGVGEVMVVEPNGDGVRRIGVGQRPVAVMPISDGKFVVANQLSDSLTLVDLNRKPEKKEYAKPDVKGAEYKKDGEYKNDYESGYAGSNYSQSYGGYGSSYLDRNLYISHLRLGPTPKLGPAERGEQLFFNARLSHASWMSCHSCHTDGHANGGMADTFGDNSSGAPKRVISLLGVGQTGPWGWNGKKMKLEDQVHQSVNSTMRGRGIPDEAAKDIAAFLRTLPPPPQFHPAESAEDVALVKQGRAVFESSNCAECHAGEVLTSKDRYDVGLIDKRGLREYSPPSLRGVGHRDALFHEKQAKSVEEVIGKFRHELADKRLSDEQKRALIRYLKSL